MPAWRAVLAGLVLLGLGAALVYVVMAQADEGRAPVPTLVSSPANPAGTADPAVTLSTAAPSSTTSTSAPPLLTSTIASAPPVVEALEDALAAWGRFAVTGRMRDLGTHFVVGGPQRRQLRAESEALQADPPGSPPYEVTTGNVFTLSVSATDVVMRVEVTWAREGDDTQDFLWDVQMQLVDNEWRLLTVGEVADGGS